MEKCKLCRETKKIVRSHIIPNSFYKDLFDEKNRMLISSFDGKKVNNKIQQTGEWEWLLCEDCDSRLLGPWDDYGKQVFIDQDKIQIERFDHPRLIFPADIAKGLDYKKLKLFLISMLWRSGISQRPIFKQIDLGPHEEKLRQMILNENPGEETEYPCTVFTTRHFHDFGKGWTFPPKSSKLNGHNCIDFFITGIQFTFFISNHDLPNWVKRTTIRKNGELILNANRENAMKLINGHARIKLY